VPAQAPDAVVVLGVGERVHVEHHEEPRRTQRREHAVEHVHRLEAREATAADVVAFDDKRGLLHDPAADRQPNGIVPVPDQVVDVVAHVVLPQLVHAATGLEARPICALDAKLRLRVAAIVRRNPYLAVVGRDGEVYREGIWAAR